MKDFGDSGEETPPGKKAEGGEDDVNPSSEIEPANRDEPLLLPAPAPPAFGLNRESTDEATTVFGSPSLAEMEAAERAMGEEAERGGKRRRLGLLWEIVEIVLLAFLIFLAVRASFQNFRVQGLSMTPSLQNGQYLIVNKLAYSTIDTEIFDWVPLYDAGEDSVHHIFGAPGRGDVVVFQAPNDQQKDFIKRIIGVPGDHIEVSQGDVILNGEVLEEPYVDGDTTCPADCVLDVPKKNYFVMGDNRANSSDSRTFGPIPEDNIIGKAFISYWPLDDAGWAPNQSISYARDSAGTEE